MKRNALIKYIKANGCEFIREGGRHSWWINSEMNKRSAVPRHTTRGGVKSADGLSGEMEISHCYFLYKRDYFIAM
ncbi:MAG: type II toxin-antitoxin system HicA family toxin [Candidatus Scalindua sp.]